MPRDLNKILDGLSEEEKRELLSTLKADLKAPNGVETKRYIDSVQKNVHNTMQALAKLSQRCKPTDAQWAKVEEMLAPVQVGSYREVAASTTIEPYKPRGAGRKPKT